MSDIELTKEWHPFNGDYQKKMQDLKLFNGDIVFYCWPNAGEFGVLVKKNNQKYYGRPIKRSEIEFVRLTHFKLHQ